MAGAPADHDDGAAVGAAEGATSGFLGSGAFVAGVGATLDGRGWEASLAAWGAGTGAGAATAGGGAGAGAGAAAALPPRSFDTAGGDATRW